MKEGWVDEGDKEENREKKRKVKKEGYNKVEEMDRRWKR